MRSLRWIRAPDEGKGRGRGEGGGAAGDRAGATLWAHVLRAEQTAPVVVASFTTEAMLKRWIPIQRVKKERRLRRGLRCRRPQQN
jgi:hypothetical protein